jgi:ribosome biogenesis protein Nip4
LVKTDSINSFAKLLGAELRLDERFVAKRTNRYFLLNRELKELAEKCGGWFSAGTYLGEVKGGEFHPSFPLLFMIAEKAKNKVTVDDKSAWLFVCGRDLFKEGILKIEGSQRKGDYTLVFNRYGECLGYGRIVKDLKKLKGGLAVKNLLDIGDFLRRECPTVQEV